MVENIVCGGSMSSTNNISSLPQVNESDVEDFDLLILGGGTGSTIAAWTFAGEGKRVAVVDRRYIGGSCPNIACLPSKNIIHSAKVASLVRRSQEFGIAHKGSRLTCLASVNASAQWCAA
jgi:pyruvate/2-oxoglutarate dehydrogenase complex dihydrolipoamide dehydrogenase (E3) component